MKVKLQNIIKVPVVAGLVTLSAFGCQNSDENTIDNIQKYQTVREYFDFDKNDLYETFRDVRIFENGRREPVLCGKFGFDFWPIKYNTFGGEICEATKEELEGYYQTYKYPNVDKQEFK